MYFFFEVKALFSSDSILPSGDDISASLMRRLRELRLPQIHQRQSQEIFKQQAIAILSVTPQGRSLLAECHSIKPDADESLLLTCCDRDAARFLRDLYLSVIESHGDWRTLPKNLYLTWPGGTQKMRVPCSFAANFPSAGSGEQSPQPAAEPSPATLLNFTPRSADEIPIVKMWESPLPASIVSMRTEQVIAANLNVIGFCNEPYDEIAGYSVRQLFEQRSNDSRYQATDLTNFHERLKKDKVIHGEIQSWRSSGAFAKYPGTFEFHVIAGIPCRLTFFEPVEIIT